SRSPAPPAGRPTLARSGGARYDGPDTGAIASALECQQTKQTRYTACDDSRDYHQPEKRSMSDAETGLMQQLDVTPRGFVMTSLAAGFALATQPISAQTITTDTQGLTAGEVKIPVGDGEIPAYRALPAAGGPFPVVLVVQEIFGVHEHIKDICRRLAKL